MDARSPFPEDEVLVEAPQSVSSLVFSNSSADIDVKKDGMVYTRGSRDDFDNWGRVTGDPRWSWDALWPYILRVGRRSAHYRRLTFISSNDRMSD